MIAKGKKLVHYVEVFFEDKTKRPVALVYKIEGYGEFIRRDKMWLPFDDTDPDVLDGAEYIVVERSDAKKLKLVEKFDNNEAVSRDEIFKYGTDKYDGGLPDENSREHMPNKRLVTSGAEQLDPRDKEMFLNAWDLEDGEVTDLQILMAIKNGQL